MEFHVVLNVGMPIIDVDRSVNSVGPKILYAPESAAVPLWALCQKLYGKNKFLRKTQKPIEDRRKSPFLISVNYYYFLFFFSYRLLHSLLNFLLQNSEIYPCQTRGTVRFRTSNYGHTDSSYKFP